jgi:hemerythrin-like domain-containing protein
MAATTTSADPVELITTDHRRVEHLFDEIESTQSKQKRGELVDRLVTELAVHMRLEEDHVYPFVRSDIDPEMAQEAETEHDLARDALERLCSLAPDEPGFGAALDMVRAGIKHHVEDEETELLPQLEKKMTTAQLSELGAALAEAKGKLLEAEPTLRRITGRSTSRGRARRTSDRNGRSTKAELVEQAKKQRLTGYSRMTRDQLEQALSRA